MPYSVLTGQPCALNARGTTQDKSDDSRDCLCGELEQIFDNISKCHIKG